MQPLARLRLRPLVSRRRVARFFGEMYVLIAAGVTIARSVELLAQQEEEWPGFKAVLEAMVNRLHAGETFSSVLAAHPECFDRFSCALMQMGERASFAKALAEAARALERQEDLRLKLLAAIRYPAIVVMVSVAMCFALLRWILPAVFASVDASLALPLLSWPLLIAVGVVNSPLLLVGATGIGAFIAWRLALLVGPRRGHVERLLLTAPLLGRLISLTGQIQLCRTLAAQLACGVSISPALIVSSSTCTVETWRELALRAESGVRRGSTLIDAFTAQTPQHAAVFLALLKLADHVGDMPRVLEIAARLLEDELNHLLDTLIAVVEPVLVALAAVVTTFMLMGALLPIYQTVTSLGGLK